MSYCYIANRKDLKGTNELRTYYDSFVVKVAKILKRNKGEIPKNIALFFEPGEGACYNRKERKIIYRFKSENELLVDKGRLIHEAAHVVQDYPFELIEGQTCSCWAEGIADYCRMKLDPDFYLRTDLCFNPKKGFHGFAYFLVLLTKRYPAIVPDLNQLIRDNGNKLKSHDQIFRQLLNKSFVDLKRDCISDDFDNQKR